MSSMLTQLNKLMRAALLGVLLLAATAASAAGAAQSSPQPAPASAQPAPTRPPAAQDEFVPINELPESEKLPAAPFLIAAYTIVWLVLLVYVWSLWRRLSQVEQELKQAVQSASLPAGTRHQ